MKRYNSIIQLNRRGKATRITFGLQQWLLWSDGTSSYVCAVLSEDVFFSDNERSSGEMAAINAFHPERAHIRVMDADFDYYVASAAMRGLRPLLGKPPESTPPNEDQGL